MRPGDPPSEPASIVGFLERRDGQAPHIRLRNLPGETPGAEGSEGPSRYRISGEIARGGIGVILKGHDVDLGRDVAMKVLRDELVHDEQAILRFVEEAQIGGQLQHPNIVPVYELGLRADRRLYFTMKLIKGQTLAALLRRREEPQGLLLVFEKICQTIAYAHARGVIHRDLKPSNVMVGAFVEVQVVDWGLAKVLKPIERGPGGEGTVISTARSGRGQSESSTGEILGTPSYMPPEQARGEVESLDERADVFALGTILCEILTGEPPYGVGDIVWNAAQGRLEEAFTRLDQAGAEPGLVALAQRCLAPDRAARPRNAGEVADAIAAHFVSMEERARRAALEAAAANARVVEAVKAKRLVIALAAAVLLAVVLGGGGYMLRAAERRDRVERTTQEVGRTLEEGVRLRGEARAGPPEDLQGWAPALAAAHRAVALARSGEADPSTRRRAAEFLEALEAEVKDRRIVARVSELRAGIVEDWDWARADAAYAEAFRDYGIDVASIDPDAAASEIRATPIAGRLAVALEDWAQARKRRAGGGEAGAAMLVALAKAADPDVWRTRLREAADPAALRALEASADVAALPAETLDALAAAFGRTGDVEHAVFLYRMAQRLHPRDVWIVIRLAHWLQELPSPPVDEEARCWAATVALRPRSHTSWADLAAALDDLRDLDGSIAASREAVRLRPDFAAAHSNLGNTLRKKGDLPAAAAACLEAIRLDPGLGSAHLNLGHARADQRDAEGAIAAFREGVRVSPASADLQNSLGNALFDKGDMEGALAAYTEAIRIDPRLAMAYTNMARILEAGGDLSAARDACREAIRIDPEIAGAHDSIGRILRRGGDAAASLAEEREAVFLEPRNAGYRVGLANALDDLGEFECAIAEYKTAIRLDPGFALAYSNLGVVLRHTGDLAGALAAQREAVRLDPTSPINHNNLGMALRARGDVDGAAAAFRQAILIQPSYTRAYGNLGELLLWKRDRAGMVALFRDLTERLPDSADAHTNLGLALLQSGLFREALASLEEARALAGRTAGGGEILECKGLLAIEARLPALLSGQAKPASPAESAEIARVCTLKEMPRAAADFYRRAFEAEPALAADLGAGHRYAAACAAALAARGGGKDGGGLDPDTRLALRRAARAWLLAELKEADRDRDFLLRTRCDPDLGAIRDEALIPATEREECRALWAEVDAQLARAK